MVFIYNVFSKDEYVYLDFYSSGFIALRLSVLRLFQASLYFEEQRCKILFQRRTHKSSYVRPT